MSDVANALQIITPETLKEQCPEYSKGGLIQLAVNAETLSESSAERVGLFYDDLHNNFTAKMFDYGKMTSEQYEDGLREKVAERLKIVEEAAFNNPVEGQEFDDWAEQSKIRQELRQEAVVELTTAQVIDKFKEAELRNMPELAETHQQSGALYGVVAALKDLKEELAAHRITLAEDDFKTVDQTRWAAGVAVRHPEARNVNEMLEKNLPTLRETLQAAIEDAGDNPIISNAIHAIANAQEVRKR